MATEVTTLTEERAATKTNGGVKLPIYMDNHATTPVDPRVLEEMLPYFTDRFGNAASRNHSFGWAGEEAVETARERIAKLIGATTKEIIFTSGATESDNLAIKGVAEMYREKGNHIITAVTEHKAVLDTCKRLEKYGYRVTYLPVQKDGLVDLDDLKRAIDDKTILVTIMAANNEIGVVQPIAEIGKLCHEKGVIFHSDATQAVGKIPIDVIKQNLDLLSISAHKMYGPKGVGALYVRRKSPRVQISPIIDGGGHERGMRSGTLNVPGIAGLGKACALCYEEMPQESVRMSGMRDRLRDRIMSNLDEVYINGSMEHRLPQNLNISFAYVEGESLLMGINDVAVSSGSACTSATLEPSYVLKALGTGDDLAHSSIRFGLGRFNTEAEVDYVADRVVETVQRLRELSPLYEMAKEGIDLKSVKWAAE
ncbi:MAG: IscS subfamily cysteine desulfurase [Acidobacteria bacterium]|nr:MAG: IscS subfamily cysteine desulfurase [Acidobacteriota bacterium]PYV65494.1 MAG: IscS subfamily cysteine desulfurase [Acidobacteriota bacterium]